MKGMIKTSNELTDLSNDINIISSEIKGYQQMASQSIFEIGRRLKWVKENDLVHGKYGEWLSSMKIDQTFANRAVKIVNELSSNSATSPNLTVNVLYEIATMPEEERDKPHHLPSGEVKKPDEMTVRELREVKKQLKHREEELDDRNAELEQLRNQKPKVVEKQVEVQVEKEPADYFQAKQKANQLPDVQSKLDKALEDVDYYQRQLKASEQIKKNAEMPGKLDQQELDRLRRKTETNAYSISYDIKEFLAKQTVITANADALHELDDKAANNLKNYLTALQKFIDETTVKLNGRKYIEGVIES